MTTAGPARDDLPMTDHTAKAFDADLRELTRMISELGHLVEKQIADALTNRNSELGQRAIAFDPQIDALQHEIEEKAVLTIARRQPMAIDLREIIGAIRTANDLERVGDLAKDIGKRVLPLSDDLHPANLIVSVEHMGTLVLERIRMRAIVSCSPRAAMKPRSGSGRTRPTWSFWIGCCPGCPASSSAAGCARGQRHDRCRSSS